MVVKFSLWNRTYYFSFLRIFNVTLFVNSILNCIVITNIIELYFALWLKFKRNESVHSLLTSLLYLWKQWLRLNVLCLNFCRRKFRHPKEMFESSDETLWSASPRPSSPTPSRTRFASSRRLDRRSQNPSVIQMS